MNVIKHFIADCATMTGRSTKHLTRNFDTLIMSLVVPVMILLVFNYLFGGAIDTGSEVEYINFVVPGIIILCVGYSASTTSLAINTDVKNGIVDRFRAMPISRSSFLIGHLISALIRNVATTIIVVLISLAIGFRPQSSLNDWLIVIAILLLFAFMVTSLAAMFGMLAKGPDGASIFGFVMMFLPYFSSAFVPIESMPQVIRGFATHQPISVVLETIKSLFLNSHGGSIILSLVWCASLGLGAVVLSALIYAKKGR